ncbi:hypothetical protein [Paenibacillus odorifer]|uniref:hypothetical protein n=1 Tax=Paenibacillus odorifer TaxID=189426 RepID=UPI00096CEDDC|nr:hypothetical protein [Paenibacillus odorifer]OMD71199.1 hypothetical protein BSK50_26315 [Paenibacillus odorifer]
MTNDKGKKKVQYIQIPNALIRDPNLTSLDFLILIKLKQLQFINGSYEFCFNSKEHIKLPLNINDNRTVKKSLDNLYKHKYILQPVKIDSHSFGKVMLNSLLINAKNNYTHVYTSVMKKLPLLGYNGFRLLFYYESYINRKAIGKASNQFCYTSIDTISKETGLTNKTIIKYNELLKKERFLDIDKHELGTDYRYDENDKVIFNRYNNHYFVRLENIL